MRMLKFVAEVQMVQVHPELVVFFANQKVQAEDHQLDLVNFLMILSPSFLSFLI